MNTYDATEQAYKNGYAAGMKAAMNLPCKIGEDIWWINKETMTVECEENGVAGFVITKDEILILDKYGSADKIGTQYCFLTKEDAEKALAEMSVTE